MAIEPVTDSAAVQPAAVPAALQITPDDELKRVRLVKMKRVATLMLVVVALVFVVARWFESQYPWLGFVRAFAEAAMVGGIADWFAVTALFRHPLGIPIPHTAIVASRKDRIGTALGNFVQRNFLTREVVAGKIAAMKLGDRAAQWLARPENSRRLARHAAHGLSGAVGVMRDEDVQEMVDRGIVSRLRRMQAAPLMARLFELMTTGGRHQALLDDALRLAAKFLFENEAMIREKVKAESPWWVPGAVDSRVGDKIVSGVEKTLVAVAADPDHPLRQRYDEAVDRFVLSLRENPETIARFELIKLDVLAHPGVADFSREVWGDVKEKLANYAERLADDAEKEPDQLEQWLAGLGQKVLEDPVLSAKVNGWIVEIVSYSVEQAREEVAKLISATVAAWDADATSRKIELQIGRDLQFIRINGTIVGGLVGLILYSVGLLLNR
ncbi:DUF445 domain-containing protein [Gemmatimonas groenlandica]|uniref:DUF445 domain-containing protein n=1 Tax=Gemmatimonas groenlandica TaxID=2732249 RepID=A0A6M4IM59_9BACT|nr:DUF445 domain-containing protein [Gemmatimonas groenlandica]QJR34496.1 DUF445 domain-containing protein [Gemmatimonas groenlandica]